MSLSAHAGTGAVPERQGGLGHAEQAFLERQDHSNLSLGDVQGLGLVREKAKPFFESGSSSGRGVREEV